MPTLNLGRVRFNMRGPYDPGAAYLKHDVVTDDGQSYACIADVTGTGPNDAGGATYWEGMLLRGADYNAARDQAVQAASNAGNSATAASQSANAAASDRDDAQSARDQSQAWAESDTAPEPGSKSAKTWAAEAASYGDPNQHNVTANGTADTRTAAEWAGQTLSNQQAINDLGTASAANVGTGADDVPKTSQADARYARLSGGNDFDLMPTVNGDPIVESDSNSDGSWTKYADGTQTCVDRRTETVSITSSYGPDYYFPYTWSFPSTFVGDVYTDAGFRSPGSITPTASNQELNSATQANHFIMHHQSATVTGGMSLFAHGRWK